MNISFIKYGLISSLVLTLSVYQAIPEREFFLAMARGVHFTVEKSENAETMLELAGNEIEYSLNVSIDNVSSHLRDAIIASEDRRFADRSPLYLIARTGQAILVCVREKINIFSSRKCAGNSAITQQLAKQLLISNKRNFRRKILELLWALKMEVIFSKEQILEMYMNRVPLGANVFGVEAAARKYFGKSASQLDLRESALVVGSVRGPRINVESNFAAAVARGNLVLRTMFLLGYFDRKVEIPTNYIIRKGGRKMRRPYFKHHWYWLKPEIEESLSQRPAGVYKVYASTDAEVQIYAELVLEKRIDSLLRERVRATQGAIVVMRPDGKVLSMVGGAGDSLKSRNTNRAVRVQGLHCPSPASTLKLVVYAGALELGLRPDSLIDASPVEIKDGNGNIYKPDNVDGKDYGDIPVAKAFSSSVNTAAVQLLHNKVGYARWFDVAARFGLPIKHIDRELGIAIGQPEICLIEMMGAYGTVANQGYAAVPQGFFAISDADGNMVVNRFKIKSKRVFSRRVINDLDDMLALAVTEGTAMEAGKGLQDLAIAGKTGTTNKSHDAWFVGYTTGLVIGVWIGNDHPTSMGGLTGGKAPAKIFNELMHSLSKHTKLVEQGQSR